MTSDINYFASNVAERAFDAIILHSGVVESDGIRAGKGLQKYHPDAKIIITSTFEGAREGVETAGFVFLLKPISTVSLSECLECENMQKVSAPSSSRNL